MELNNRWKFDFRTALIMMVVTPLLIFLLKIVLKHLKRWSGYLLEGAMYWFSRSIMHSLSGALTLRRYCRLQLAAWNQYLHVPSSLDITLDIDRVYVTLILERQGGIEGRFTHADLLRAGNRIRVIGDPGSGKSSLVKRLFRDACHKAIKNPRRAQLPVFLELKNLNIPADVADASIGQWLLKKLRDDAKTSAVYQMGECFESYAETVGLLVLLDGLDEVSTSNYHRVQLAIQQLSSELARFSELNNIVLTMRTQFHQQIKDVYRDSFALAMFLKPFSPSDIYEFLTRWPFGEHADQSIARIYSDLTDRPTLREMCTNPLILSMYVADDQAAGHLVAPETRTEFYSKVTEELIVRRRLQQTRPAVAYTKLREQRERILGRIAYEHLLDPEQPTNSLQWSDAIAVVRDVMGCPEVDAEALFRELARETGLITEERPEVLRILSRVRSCPRSREWLGRPDKCAQGISIGGALAFTAN
jgi:GTPase SAR1 family protein